VSVGLQNKLFDHKAIFLDFTVKEIATTAPTISRSILKEMETELVVGLAVIDTYIRYSAIVTENEKNELNVGCGNAWNELRSAGIPDEIAAPGDRTEIEHLTRAGKIASVREYLEFVPYARLRDGALSIPDDIFMECLINNIRNEVVSYQQFQKKVPIWSAKNFQTI